MARVNLAARAALTVGLVGIGACTDSSRESPTSPAAAAGSSADHVISVALGAPLPGLSAEELEEFARGAVVFADSFGFAQGLGPLYNGFFCADCHSVPVNGGVGNDPNDVERHATAYRGGVCDPLTAEGGFVIQNHTTPGLFALSGDTAVPLPAGRTGVGLRTTPQVFGRGLLEAVPDDELIDLARRERFDPNNIAGTPSIIGGRVARFGRKDNSATLSDFTAGAFLNEMGITTPLKPHEYGFIGTLAIPDSMLSQAPEVNAKDFAAAVAFMRYLAPPSPLPRTPQTEAGEFQFARTGCASCHVQMLMTGWSPVRALRFQPVHAYSDLLLHDMGPGLADICLNAAKPDQFRTEPLMGISQRTQFLHDGRAKTIEQAILLHGGQAERARNRFRQLSPAQRAALEAYVGSL